MDTTAAPRLRSNLTVREQETPAGLIYTLKNEATGRFFRLREPEYFIAQQLDGDTSLETIRERFECRFGQSLSHDELTRFIDRLDRAGLLEGSEHTSPHHQGRVRGSLLYKRFKVFDPDALFDRLLPFIRWCFTPTFLWTSVALIFLAVGQLISHSRELSRSLDQLYAVESLVLAWLAIIIVGTLHEFAHGLTCKHFGGRVHEIGVMLLYFQPAFYCNVSDAWLFPEKSKRLWVTFAGAYFELVVWALAVLTWRVTDPTTWINYLCLVVMASTGLKIFFNLNPLIKLDGYYLLSDALEIPNLRQRAFRYVGQRFRALWIGSRTEGPQPSARERRIYLAYGTFAGIFSVALLSFLIGRFGGLLIQRYEGAGFLATSVLVMMLLRTRLRNLIPTLPRSFRDVVGQVIRLGPSMSRPTKVLLALSGVLLLLFVVRLEKTASGEVTIRPRTNTDVRASVEGRIAEILVQEGDRVETGDLLVRLDDRDLRAKFAQCEAEMAEKQAELALLETGPSPEEVALAKAEVATAQTHLEQAQRRYQEAERLRKEKLRQARIRVDIAADRFRFARNRLQRVQPLLDQALVSQQEYEAVQEQATVREQELAEARSALEIVEQEELAKEQEAVAVAEQELKEAQNRLHLLLAGSRPEEIQAKRAELAQLEEERQWIQDRLERTNIRSPIDGIVTTPDLEEKLGAYVEPGELVLEVHKLDIAEARVAVPEEEIACVKPGQTVTFKVRPYPARTFTSTVRTVAPMAAVPKQDKEAPVTQPPPVQTFRVSSEIKNPDLILKPGMTGHAKISCGAAPLAALMTEGLARFLRVEFWSWW